MHKNQTWRLRINIYPGKRIIISYHLVDLPIAMGNRSCLIPTYVFSKLDRPYPDNSMSVLYKDTSAPILAVFENTLNSPLKK